jgi:hypothetical protein
MQTIELRWIIHRNCRDTIFERSKDNTLGRRRGSRSRCAERGRIAAKSKAQHFGILFRSPLGIPYLSISLISAEISPTKVSSILAFKGD